MPLSRAKLDGFYTKRVHRVSTMIKLISKALSSLFVSRSREVKEFTEKWKNLSQEQRNRALGKLRKKGSMPLDKMLADD